MTGQPIRFLLVGFDGLRPRDVTRESMPALAEFLTRSHVWKRYLADFPTETYVNHPSIFSGFRPGRHGLVANAYWRREFAPERAFFAGSDVSLVAGHEAAGGLLTVPSLGERLAAAGKTLRIYCANSAGSTRLQHVRAAGAKDHLVACVHDFESALPLAERKALLKTHGAGTPLSFPDFDGTKDVVDLFFERELKRQALADVTVLWIGEPDHSSHEFGLDAPETQAARAAADASFARVYEWWKCVGQAQGVQLAVLSDHGHARVVRHTDFEAILKNAGLNVVRGRKAAAAFASGETPDAVLVGDYVCGLWFTDPENAALIEKARDALAASPDTGLIFSPAKPYARPGDIEGRCPGTFSEALLGTNHARTPELRFTGRGYKETGEIVMAASLPVGTSNHGGLLAEETHALLALAGSAFAAPRAHDVPAGHIDFAKTLMSLLGLLPGLTPEPEGRLLSEALTQAEPAAAPVEETLETSVSGLLQRLTRVKYEGVTYVLSGERL